jgi:hypothetical protein
MCRLLEEAEATGRMKQSQASSVNIHLTRRAVEALAAAPLPVQKAVAKQIRFLARAPTGKLACQEI